MKCRFLALGNPKVHLVTYWCFAGNGREWPAAAARVEAGKLTAVFFNTTFVGDLARKEHEIISL